MSSLLEEDLRRVFEICDEKKSGHISVSHLLNLANQYLGSSHNNVSATVESLCKQNDVITFPEFCHVFTSVFSASDSENEVSSFKEENGDQQDYNNFNAEICESAVREQQNSIKAFETSPNHFPPSSNSKPRTRIIELNQLDSRMPKDDRGSPSSMSEFDSALGTNTTSPASVRKVHSGCSSMSDREEENYVCYGEGDDVECEFESPSTRIGLGDEVDGTSLRSPPNSLPPANFARRNSWVRRSLRGSPSSSASERVVPPRRAGSFRHAPKRVGGTAVASQLYRTSSFSSGRSSAPDQDDMYSDASLEDDVLDLNHKVQMLQQQVGVLAENQVNTDDRYSRVKQDNSALQARVMMLEEQLRDAEMRSEDRIAEEQRRNKELIARVEREKQLTVENYSIKHTNLEKEKQSLVEDNTRLKLQVEKLQKEKSELEYKVTEAEYNSSSLQQENAKIGETSRREKEELRIERERGSQVIEELRCEVERLRAVEESYRKRSPSVDSTGGNTAEMEAELKQLKEDNKLLLEQVEELQAQLLTTRLEEGRTLVSATNNSLAAEFEQMTSDEEAQNSGELEKLRKSLKDCQEANQHLRAYIDGILLNIVENYPQLLEVKHK